MLAGLPTHSEDLPERMPQTVTNLSKPVLFRRNCWMGRDEAKKRDEDVISTMT